MSFNSLSGAPCRNLLKSCDSKLWHFIPLSVGPVRRRGEPVAPEFVTLDTSPLDDRRRQPEKGHEIHIRTGELLTKCAFCKD